MSTTIPTRSGFAITRSGESEVLVSETPGGRADVGALAVGFAVVHPDVELELRLLAATNGERWVEARNIRSFLTYVPRLEGRLRLTIDPHGAFSLCALRLAVPKGESWANLYDATLAQLCDASGVPVARELKSVGAIDVGSRHALLEDTGRTRRRLIATFAHPNEEVPVLAFVLTRLAPLVRASLPKTTAGA